MHELSIALALIEQLEELAKQHHASRVESLQVECGPLSGVEPELLTQAFLLAKEGTVAQQAQLEILVSELQIHCPDCHHTFSATPNDLLCPACGSFVTKLVQGDGLILRHVELILH